MAIWQRSGPETGSPKNGSVRTDSSQENSKMRMQKKTGFF